MSKADAFNRTALSRFVNSSAGRVFRLVAGLAFLTVGLLFRDHVLGVIALAWSALPLSAAALDVCWISAVLGGPLAGTKIRAFQGQLASPGVGKAA